MLCTRWNFVDYHHHYHHRCRTRGACCDSVKKVRPHHASAERIPLAAHGTACAVQADADCFQVPPWPVAPSYLTDDCVLVSCVAGRRPLRSVDTRTLYVPRTRTAIGARNFAVAGPRVWNSLPPELRMLKCTVCTFAVKLKTFLFSAVSASESF